MSKVDESVDDMIIFEDKRKVPHGVTFMYTGAVQCLCGHHRFPQVAFTLSHEFLSTARAKGYLEIAAGDAKEELRRLVLNSPLCDTGVYDS